MLQLLSDRLNSSAELSFALLPNVAVKINSYLLDNLGQTATFAVYLAIAAILLLAAWRLLKFSFDLLRFVILPTIAVGFIGSLILPYSFFHIVPFAAILFSSLLFLKG